MESELGKIEYAVVAPDHLTEYEKSKQMLIWKLMHSPSYSSFNAMQDLSNLARNAIESAVESNGIDANGVLLFGSMARNEASINSDVDLGVITDDLDVEITQLQSKLSGLSTSGVDIQFFKTDDIVDQLAGTVMEGNKIRESQSLHINDTFEETWGNLIDSDLFKSKELKIRNLICEVHLLRKFFYLYKPSDLGPDLKYDFGSLREVIIFNWITSLFSDSKQDETQPQILKSIEFLVELGFISMEDSVKLLEAIDLLYLFNNVASVSGGVYSGWKDYIDHLNPFTIQVVFDRIKNKLKARFGINSVEEFNDSIYSAKQTLFSLSNLCFQSSMKLFFKDDQNSFEGINSIDDYYDYFEQIQNNKSLVSELLWFITVPHPIY
jgi:predicted nucleotidyltransferase